MFLSDRNKKGELNEKTKIHFAEVFFERSASCVPWRRLFWQEQGKFQAGSLLSVTEEAQILAIEDGSGNIF